MFIKATKYHHREIPGQRVTEKIVINSAHIIAVEELKYGGTMVTCSGVTPDEITTYVLEDEYEEFVDRLSVRRES